MDTTQPDVSVPLNLDSAAEKILNIGTPPVEETPEGLSEETTEEVVEGTEVEAEAETEEAVETEASEAEGQEPEGQEDISELNEWLLESPDMYEKVKVKTKVNGEEYEVTLKELVDTKQIAQNVEERHEALKAQKAQLKEIEEKATAEYHQRINQAESLISSVEQQIVNSYQKVDWDDLRETDPAEFTAKKQELMETQQWLNSVKQNAVNERQKTFNEQYTNAVQRETEAILHTFPEWKDEAVASAEKAEIRDYILSSGFQPREVDGLVDQHGNVQAVGFIDHRLISMAKKAMLFDKGKKEVETVKKKVRSVPKMAKAGRPESVKEKTSAQQAAQRARLKKSGDIYDAASLIKDRLFGG